MGFGDGVLLRRIGLGMISFTGALAVLLGGWILISAFSNPPENMNEVKRTLAKAREPASVLGVEPRSLQVEKSDSKVETLSLGCLRDGSHLNLQSAAKHVRLLGKLCGGRKTDLEQSSLVNRANGYAATLFNLTNGHFTSDYIALADGSNSLMLELEDSHGRRTVAEVTISKTQDVQ